MEPNRLSRRIEQLAALDEPDLPGALAVLRAEVAAVRAELGSVRGELGSVRTDLDGMSGRLISSVAASRTETGALVRRVGELGGRLAETIGSRVDEVGHDLHRTLAVAQERDADTAAATQAATGEARAAIESRMAVIEDALEATAERLEALTRDGARHTRDQLRELGASSGRVEGRLDATAGEQVERIVARLREVTVGQLDALASRLGAQAASGQEALTAGVDRVIEDAALSRIAVQDAGTAAVAALQAASDRARDALAEQVRAALAEQAVRERQLREDLAAVLAAVGALAARQATVEEATRHRAQADRIALVELVSTSREGLREVLTAQAAELGQSAAAAVAGLRADVAGALEAVGARLSELVEAETEAVTLVVTDSGRLAGEATRSARQVVLERLEEQHVAVTGRLAELAAADAGSTAATRDTGERLAGLTSSTEDVRRALQTLQGDWPIRVDQAVAAAREVADASVAGMRTEVRSQLDAVLAAMERATGRVEEARERLEAAARSQVTTHGPNDPGADGPRFRGSVVGEPAQGAAGVRGTARAAGAGPRKAAVPPKQQPSEGDVPSTAAALRVVPTVPKRASARAAKTSAPGKSPSPGRLPSPGSVGRSPAGLEPRPAPRGGQGRRGRLDEMPQVPGPGRVLDLPPAPGSVVPAPAVPPNPIAPEPIHPEPIHPEPVVQEPIPAPTAPAPPAPAPPAPAPTAPPSPDGGAASRQPRAPGQPPARDVRAIFRRRKP